MCWQRQEGRLRSHSVCFGERPAGQVLCRLGFVLLSAGGQAGSRKRRDLAYRQPLSKLWNGLPPVVAASAFGELAILRCARDGEGR